MYWFTDCTPFEWVPLKYTTFVQMFQLVTGDVALWFEDYYTQNPLGVVPDPTKTLTVRGHSGVNNPPGNYFHDRQQVPAQERLSSKKSWRF